MRNATGGGTSTRADGRSDCDHALVSDLQALIEYVQTSIRLIEQTIAGEAFRDDQEIAANLIVLDDVTPRYLKANAALSACRASLGVAVQFLGDARPLNEADSSGTDDCHPAWLTGRA